MKYSEARQGRIFIIRLEDGEIVHEALEQFADEHHIRAAALIILGGADAGSALVVGPKDGRAATIEPMRHLLEQVHEIAGTGTIFPDDDGSPILHCHIACGREGKTVAGCVRSGVKVWQVMEVIMYELLDTEAVRRLDDVTGFKLLQPTPGGEFLRTASS